MAREPHLLLRALRLGLIAMVAGAVMLGAAATAADDARDRIVAAVLTTYVHGIDEAIANFGVGPEGVPVLHQLLRDPTFSRRDNVVAFLTYLGDNDSARALNDFLRKPPASPERAEEDRALLLVPHALGEIAARGNSLALRVLMTATRNRSNGGALAAAAAHARRPEAMRDDLLEMAVRGLGRSRRPAALGRLLAIAEGRAVPAPGGRELGRVARAALQAFEPPRRQQRPTRPGVYELDTRLDAVLLIVATPDTTPLALTLGGAAALVPTMLLSSALDYANHVDHPSPMYDARLDEILADASIRAGRDDFGGDHACCVHFHRKGTAQTFGTPGDGLDIIDDAGEMYATFDYQATRVKVVRLINWCGAPATNFIGCGFVGGYGTAVVRYSDLASEGALWAHEYGHNTGLGHNTSNWQLIMYPTISRNSGLTAAECSQFHAPPEATRADISEIGECVQEMLDEGGLCGNGGPGLPAGAACKSHGDCCSLECMGKLRRKICR